MPGWSKGQVSQDRSKNALRGTPSGLSTSLRSSCFPLQSEHTGLADSRVPPPTPGAVFTKACSVPSMAMTPSMVWKEDRVKVDRLQSRNPAIFFFLTSGRVTNLPEGNKEAGDSSTQALTHEHPALPPRPPPMRHPWHEWCPPPRTVVPQHSPA